VVKDARSGNREGGKRAAARRKPSDRRHDRVSNDQGIVQDDRGQDQPRDKARALKNK
jgi:hypothetical protein